MKFYLSSFRLGNKVEILKNMIPSGKKIGYMPNAIDYHKPSIRKDKIQNNIEELNQNNIDFELLDLKEYFGRKKELKKKLDALGGVWIQGENTFVLRQAMKLCGFDDIIKSMDRDDFVYAGYSAGICVLAPSLKALQQVGDSSKMPYQELREVIWDGLNLLDYIILPHYKSNHPETEDIDKEVEYCKKNNINYKTLKDGEVIIIG